MLPENNDIIMIQIAFNWISLTTVQILTVSPKAAHFLILQPEDMLQPINFVEVRETSQSTNQDC